MATKLIELEDGILIEVEATEDEVKPISGGFAQKVDKTVDKIKPVMLKVCRPVIESWKELNKEVSIDEIEVQLGLSFEGEGNLYITKAKAGANISVKFVLKPQER